MSKNRAIQYIAHGVFHLRILKETWIWDLEWLVDTQQWQRVVMVTQMCDVISHCVLGTRPNIKDDVSLLLHIQKHHGGNLGE